MSVPDDATLDLLIDDMVELGFASGTASQNYAAASIAWELAESAIGSNMLTGTATEQVIFPTGWLDVGVPFAMVQLRYTYLVSQPVVIVHHEIYDCECGTEEIAGCGTVFNAQRSEVRLDVRCAAASLHCGTCPHPFMAEVSYVAGVFASYSAIPWSVKVALATLAGWWLRLLTSGGADIASGFVDSWRSMDYNESLKFLQSTVMGSSPEANAAWIILRRLRVVRAKVLRSHLPLQRA